MKTYQDLLAVGTGDLTVIYQANLTRVIDNLESRLAVLENQ